MSSLGIKAVLFHLSTRRRNQGLLLILMTAMGALLEVISLASVFPVLAFMLDPSSTMDTGIMSWLKPVFEVLPFDEGFSLGVIFAFLVLASSIYRILLVWLQVAWGNAIGHDFSVTVFRNLLGQKYEQHLARNTSEVVAGITIKINQLVGSYINPLVSICSSSVLMIAIVLALSIAAGPEVIALLSSIGLVYTGIVFTVRNKLSTNSVVISGHANSIVRQVQESFQGIREVILSGTSPAREKEFARLDEEFRQAQTSSVVLSQAPRYVVESLLVITLVSVALSQAGTISLSGDLLPALGVLALGVQRVMPLAQSIYANVATMKGAKYSVNDVLELAAQDVESKDKSINPNDELVYKQTVEVRELSYRYPGAKKDQLREVSFTINKGEWIGFYGQTGSGKSTVLDVLSGLLRPTSGSVLIDGNALEGDCISAWQRKLAVVSQFTFFADDTILRNIVPNDEEPDMDRLNGCLKVAQLYDAILQFDGGLDTRLGEAGVQLSGGQLQRLSIARALYRQADVLIFDEATSALDQNTENELMSALKQLNPEITVILVAHRLNTLSGCDRLYNMDGGQIVAVGSYSSLILNS